MEIEIRIPTQVPVMTLPEVAFFPQALMPLHIFEPRYRAMLRDSLAADRLFAVAGLDQEPEGRKAASFEPPHRVASVGIIRACQKNENGTSNLLLQGLCRVEILEIAREVPYRLIEVRALVSEPGAAGEENERLRRELSRLLTLREKLAPSATLGITDFLKTVKDPEAFADIAAFNLCNEAAMRQRLLEVLDVHRRLTLFTAHVRGQIDEIRLRRKLQGDLPDGAVGGN
ncbi:MAG: LON peptidase substrate-binding domain-containing protein [Opitutaceae bacterium]|nr:LON peptidase substrate-binding domain-containing protein [Opitutaceae bacterium]